MSSSSYPLSDSGLFTINPWHLAITITYFYQGLILVCCCWHCYFLHTRYNTDDNKLMIFPCIALYYGDTYIWFLSEAAMYFMHTQSRTRPLWFLLNKTQTESVLQWSFTCLIQSRETVCWKTTLKAGTPAVYCHLRQDAPRYGGIYSVRFLS